MPMHLIQGSYRILKTSPDGDSIRFYPDNPELWKKLGRVRANRLGGAQLRLDGIDALETHYQPRIGTIGKQQQPGKYAQAACSELLSFLGFETVERDRNDTIAIAEPEQVPGYILTRYADAYGRGVAFVFKGHFDAADGSEVYCDASLLQQSANYHLLATGLAYPTFYSKLFPDLRQEMTQATKQARSQACGLWSADCTQTGFIVADLESLTEEWVILPKLFRRLLDYLAINEGSYDLGGFSQYLETRRDRILILSQGHLTGFDYVVEVEQNKVCLTTAPEDLVFMEK
ncbi:thermonuclease family protein [Geitlerinema calcuttense]|nr:thermonuclease family protein [Geitlerinema calcuttense]